MTRKNTPTVVAQAIDQCYITVCDHFNLEPRDGNDSTIYRLQIMLLQVAEHLGCDTRFPLNLRRSYTQMLEDNRHFLNQD